MSAILEQVVEKHVKPARELIVANKPPAIGEVFAFEAESVNKVRRQSETIAVTNGQKIIDLSFLAMRKNGWPLFAIFNLSNRDCTLTASFHRGNEQPSLHCNSEKKFIKAYFKDTFAKLLDIGLKAARGKDYRTISESITCEFNGIIPETTREIIKNNRRKFDEILIIKEADKWQHKETIVLNPPNPDPLVVGVKNDIAVLLDKFDITPVEHYVSSEF